jgi:hypothetical protein
MLSVCSVYLCIDIMCRMIVVRDVSLVSAEELVLDQIDTLADLN